MTFSVDWSLIFFTVFAQAAFGIVFALLVLSFVKQPAARIVYGRVRVSAAGVALLLMAAALFFSFFHLGSPLRAVYALSNLRTSWLSREILMVSVFSFLLLLWWFLMRKGLAVEAVNRTMLWLAVFAGLIMVFTMARLYMIPSVPAWNRGGTLLVFYASGLLTGVPVLLCIIASLHSGDPGNSANYRYLRGLGWLMAVAFVVRVVTGSGPAPDPGQAAFPPRDLPLLMDILYYLLLTAGTGMILFRLAVPSAWGDRSFRRYLLVALALVFVAEITGRYIFYAGFYRLGI
ncbi:MAG: hypothetical protein EA408_13715 [Marinilabiliales bacterium]|nr:MAG: hypothetical protein EA408_13715 [Marinilabiliales bacterium]